MAYADTILTPDQRIALETLLIKHSEGLSTKSEDMDRTNLLYYKINIADNGPVRQELRRIPHEQITMLKAKVDKLQKMGAIEPSISPFVSTTILVKMKDGTMRFCNEYRKLNVITKKIEHPFPRIEDIFDTFSGFQYFKTSDLAMDYHQVEVHSGD